MFRFLLLSGVLSLMVFISVFWWLGSNNKVSPGIDVAQNGTVDLVNQQITTIEAENKISSLSGRLYDANPFINDRETEQITPEYYWNTTDERYYAIGYVESQGLITIMLLNSNLALSRQLAETQLKNLFPYTEQEFCEMNVRVYTNENVVPSYNGEYFGLSFCPFSVDL